MSTVNVIHPNSELCCKSELSLFSLPFTQYSIEDSSYQAFYPTAGVVNSESVIEFNISNLGQHYLDLESSFLHCRLRIVRSDGQLPVTKATDGTTTFDEVWPINGFGSSMFKTVSVYLNQQLVSSNELYAYRSFLDMMLHASPTIQKTVHESALFFMDEAHRRDDDCKARGVSERYKSVKGGKIVDLVARINSDIFCQPKLLLPGVDIRLVLQQNSDDFRLVGKNEQNHMIEFKSVAFYLKKVKVSPSVFLGHEKQLLKSTANYLLRGLETKVRSLPQGSLDCCIEDIYLDRIPSNLVVVMVATESFQGIKKRDPFRFSHFNLSHSVLTIDGVERHEECDFANGLARKPYFALLEQLAEKHVLLDYEHYVNNFFIQYYNLEPDSSNNYHMSPVKRGNVRLQLKFQQPLSEPITILLVSETPRVLQIDKDRLVTVE